MTELIAKNNLIHIAVAGDVRAIERLLLAYYSPLPHHIEQEIPDRVRRHFDSEDILQHGFLQVFRDIACFEPRGEGRCLADKKLLTTARAASPNVA
ncbi:MAG: hypothetical protein WD738_07195 [Pirellulales bacterium]